MNSRPIKTKFSNTGFVSQSRGNSEISQDHVTSEISRSANFVQRLQPSTGATAIQAHPCLLRNFARIVTLVR